MIRVPSSERSQGKPAGHVVGDTGLRFFVAFVGDYDGVVTSSQPSWLISKSVADMYCVPRHTDDGDPFPSWSRTKPSSPQVSGHSLQAQALVLGHSWTSSGFLRSPSTGAGVV